MRKQYYYALIAIWIWLLLAFALLQSLNPYDMIHNGIILPPTL